MKYASVLSALLAAVLLSACVSDAPPAGNGTAVETSTSKSLSAEDRARYLRLWNQPGISAKSVAWPSDGAGQYTSAGLFLSGMNSKPPASISASFRNDPLVQQTITNVYQKTILRGMDTALAKKYLRTSLGKRELRASYLFVLAKKCHGRVPKAEHQAFMAYYETGKRPPKYVCQKKPEFSEKAMR